MVKWVQPQHNLCGSDYEESAKEKKKNENRKYEISTRVYSPFQCHKFIVQKKLLNEPLRSKN